MRIAQTKDWTGKMPSPLRSLSARCSMHWDVKWSVYLSCRFLFDGATLGETVAKDITLKAVRIYEFIG